MAGEVWEALFFEKEELFGPAEEMSVDNYELWVHSFQFQNESICLSSCVNRLQGDPCSRQKEE